MNRKLLVGLGAGIAALLVAVLILLVVVIQQNNAAAEQAKHERIVEICEGGLADPYGEDLDALTRCIEELRD